MARGYSHIVIGAGAIGSAAAYWLSQRGAERVLVIEQFDLVNLLGSSGDHSRIIRHSYHRPDYVRLTMAAYQAWAEIEERSGLKVYVKTGGLDIAASTGPQFEIIRDAQRALDDVGIAYEMLGADELRSRFPQWNVDEDITGLYQEAAGLIDIRRTVSAHTSLALANGVEFLPNTKVTGIRRSLHSVTVSTTQGDFDADNLVVATASWLGELMPDLGLKFDLTLSQEQVTYFSSANLADFAPDRFPVWAFHREETYYGFPVYGEAGVKIARDMRGRFVESKDRTYQGDDKEVAILQKFLKDRLPGAVGPALVSKLCIYDMPPDRDFVLDTLPDHPGIAVFNGAGHGGKFASLVGQILADLVTTGSTEHDIAAFSLTRPAIVDPNFTPVFRLVS
jgi:monomeric sarcosine oxidase